MALSRAQEEFLNSIVELYLSEPDSIRAMVQMCSDLSSIVITDPNDPGIDIDEWMNTISDKELITLCKAYHDPKTNFHNLENLSSDELTVTDVKKFILSRINTHLEAQATRFQKGDGTIFNL